ncbi:MAG: hypothetical protein AAF745_16415 [Planctomycetota bacterium]
MTDENSNSTSKDPTSPPADDDQGPGCMPALLALIVLSGIAAFVTCGFMTWLIFQKQDVLALRSLRGNFVPAVEQSLLEPDEKARSVETLNEFADQLERKQHEGWQASGVMQRLGRLPILQWGQLRRVEAFVDNHPDDFSPTDSIQFDRIRKGVEMGEITTIDCRYILSPVLQTDGELSDPPLKDVLDPEAVAEVVKRARAMADRVEVDAEPRNDVSIDVLVQRQVDAGIQKGGF